MDDQKPETLCTMYNMQFEAFKGLFREKNKELNQLCELEKSGKDIITANNDYFFQYLPNCSSEMEENLIDLFSGNKNEAAIYYLREIQTPRNVMIIADFFTKVSCVWDVTNFDSHAIEIYCDVLQAIGHYRVASDIIHTYLSTRFDECKIEEIPLEDSTVATLISKYFHFCINYLMEEVKKKRKENQKDSE